jgi:hypothetical protein
MIKRHMRVFTVAVSLLFALAACHRELHIVRVDVFEGHVTIDGVVSNLPIQQVVDGRRPMDAAMLSFTERRE